MKYKFNVQYPEIKLIINGKEIELARTVEFEANLTKKVSDKILAPLKDLLSAMVSEISKAKVEVNGIDVEVEIAGAPRLYINTKDMVNVYKQQHQVLEFGGPLHRALVAYRASGIWANTQQLTMLKAAGFVDNKLTETGIQALEALRRQGNDCNNINIYRALLAVKANRIRHSTLSDYLVWSGLAVDTGGYTIRGYIPLELTPEGTTTLKEHLTKLLPYVKNCYLEGAIIDLLPITHLSKYLTHEDSDIREAAKSRMDELQKGGNR